ncbi:hypothetical protein D3C81_2129660 [compost metagenome]
MLSWGIQQPQIAMIAAEEIPLWQHLHNLTAGKRLVGGKVGQAADTDMLFHRV